MNNIFYIYIHRRKTDNEIFYVGKGKEKRASAKDRRNKYWRNTVNKYGYFIEIAYNNLSENNAFDLEKEAIKACRDFGCPLVNMTDGGEGPSGCSPSVETRKKIGDKSRLRKKDSLETRMKKGQSWRGKKHTKEGGAKIAKANKNRIITPETRLKMSESHTNPSIETRYKMSRYASNRPNEVILKISSSRGSPVKCIETGEIYRSARYAAKVFGIDRSCICRVCNGVMLSIRGYRFKWIEKGTENAI